ncbi:MAG: type IX secretion system membrane protein PorP/SprF [Flavobacteriales bacterium]|nr:type IX secretion system membrane protein PorP/SprF [Flavobacteriales bacterium]
MKKIILISMLCILGLQGFSQQDPQYSLYMFNPLGVNPGYAGSREVLSAVLVHRSQWIGLEGAPETQVLALNSPLRNKKMGLGLQIINDKIGAHNTVTIKGTYAYRLKMGKGKLAFGLSGGIQSYTYDWAKVEYKDAEDAIPTTSAESFIIPTVDFGIYYNTRTMYLGVAAEHINQASFGFSKVDGITTSQNGTTLNGGVGSGTAKKYANIIATFGKAFIINDDLVLKASTLLRFSNGGGSIDLNGGVLLKNKIYFGASLRQNAVVLLTELNITKNLRMGIAYDLDVSDVAKSTSGSLELFLGYDVGLFKSKIVSPRYF